MATSLKLLIYGRSPSNWAHTVIVCDWEDYDKIGEVAQLEIDPGFSSYFAYDEESGEHYGEMTTDARGHPLKYTYARHLREVVTDPAPRAFLEALPDKRKVALYWC